MKKGLKLLIAAAIAVVVLVVGGWLVYANFINDPEEELTTQDLDDRLNDTTPVTEAPTTEAPTTEAPTTEAPTTEAPTTEAPTTDAPTTEAPDTAAEGADGTWTVGAGSEVGYRVAETLGGVATEGVGRTSQIEGSLTIEGTQATAAEFTVDVASITSDSDRRDSQFTGRIMETEQFPTASFVLTSPIEFGEVPPEGEQITATATGDLTLHGVTKTVSFEVTAQIENGRVGVLGNIPVLFADYDIDNPSFGPVETEDNGLLEILLIFER
jgi:polyisoprenoid-binding protein YceI